MALYQSNTQPSSLNYTPNQNMSYGNSSSTPAAPNMSVGTAATSANSPGFSTPTPKKTTTTVTEYHPPAGTVNVGTASNPILQPTGGSQQSTPQYYDQNTGLLTSAGIAAGMPQVNQPKTTSTGLVQPTQPAAATTAPTAPSFSGILGTLVNNATNGSQDVQKARQALTDFQTKIGQQYANIESQAIPLQFQQGREQALQRANATTESALQTGVSNALQGQQQQFSALNAAAGLAQPSTAAYGQTVFNPLTGQYENGGGLPDSVLQQYAQMAANGQYSAIPSSITSNPVLSAQLNSAAKSINPNYNPITSTAQGAAAASNVQTAGTTGTNVASSGYQQAIQSYNSMNSQNQSADAQAKNVQDILAQTGLNQVGSTDYTKAINSLSGRLGSTGVTKLNTALTELQAIYTSLLSAGGGTPTGNETQALSVLNPNSSAAQITASIQQLQIAAYNKLNAQYNQAQTYYQNLNGSGTSSSGNSSGGSGGSIWSF